MQQPWDQSLVWDLRSPTCHVIWPKTNNNQKTHTHTHTHTHRHQAPQSLHLHRNWWLPGNKHSLPLFSFRAWFDSFKAIMILSSGTPAFLLSPRDGRAKDRTSLGPWRLDSRGVLPDQFLLPFIYFFSLCYFGKQLSKAECFKNG